MVMKTDDLRCQRTVESCPIPALLVVLHGQEQDFISLPGVMTIQYVSGMLKEGGKYKCRLA